MTATLPVVDPGLDDRAVNERLQAGKNNRVKLRTSRTMWNILRTNLFTPFNALLGFLLVVILIVGPIQDALFGFVLISNVAIGVIQEWRAKRALDRLSIVTNRTTRVRRNGTVALLSVDDIVIDDLIELEPGSQIPVDATVLSTHGLEVDEALLTGESDPVVKHSGDEVRSGSFVVAGSGECRVTRIGKDTYAFSLTDQARKFSLAHSELRRGTNRIIVFVSWFLVPAAVLLMLSELRYSDLEGAIRGAVAGTVTMVPEGLVLLTGIAFGVGALRLARSKVLVQDLPAIETLARVDVLCIDKTGTLTYGKHRIESIESVGNAVSAQHARDALGALAHADRTPNATMQAIRDSLPSPSWAPTVSVQFSSERKWSGASFDGRGTWVLGAPEVVAPFESWPEALRMAVDGYVATGRRLLLLAHSEQPFDDEDLPKQLQIVALVVLVDGVRSDAAEVLRYFSDEQVVVKVISGDHPATVASIARQAGVANVDGAIDARQLQPSDIAHAVEEHNVFARVTPRQKQMMVKALQDSGHTVAMTGDGVNDIPALKQADLAIAMGNGAPACRAAAHLILLDSTFARLPRVVAEGRRLLTNIERTASLFLVKTSYAFMLVIAVGLLGVPFPFWSRHLTLVAGLTVGIPAFFLALAPGGVRSRPGFVNRVLHFSVPVGMLAGGGTLLAYLLIRSSGDADLMQQRTASAITLFWIGLLILAVVAEPLDRIRTTLLVAMAGLFGLVLAVPQAREFFGLAIPPLSEWIIAVGVTTLMFLLLRLLFLNRSHVLPGR